MRKLKVIIVEDEHNIREGIADFVKMESNNYEVSGLFSDGDEAIEYLKENDVDLVITDVKMNRVSGIELVKYLHENKPKILAIILSGYKEFEYIKSAMTYQVYDYMLKPTDYNELKRILDKTADVIRKRENETETNISYENMISELRREFFVSLLAGTFKSNEIIEKKVLFLKMGKEFLNSKCAIVKIDILNKENFFNNVWKYGRDNFNKAIENLIFTAKDDLNCDFYFVGDYNKALCMFALERKSRIGFEENLKQDLKMFTEMLLRIIPNDISFTLDRIYENPLELAANIKSTDDKGFSERSTLLKTYISVADEEETNNLADLLFAELKSAPLPYIKGKLVEIFYSVYVPEGSKLILEENMKNLAAAQSIEEIERLYYKHLAFLLECSQRLLGDSQNLIIKRAKQYIKKNFSKDISLLDVSNYVNLNQIYFSKYFKEHTNKNFVDYLTDVRIEFAKQELIKGKKIDEVSRLSGYNNSSYFAKIFKNSTGMTPSEYQRIKTRCE